MVFEVRTRHEQYCREIFTIEELVNLPDYDYLAYIKCRDCNLIALPDRLPCSLRGLYCDGNHLKELPICLLVWKN